MVDERVAHGDLLTAGRLWLPAFAELRARVPGEVDLVSERAGVSHASVEDLRGRVSLRAALAFLRESERATNDRLFAMRAGRRYDRASFDLLMRALLAQPDGNAAMSNARRFVSLAIEGLGIAYVLERDRRRIVLSMQGGPLTDASLAGYLVGLISRLTDDLGGGNLPVLDVEFAHAARADARVYRTLLGVPIVFGAKRTSLALPAVNLGLPDADPVLAALLVEQAEAVLRSMPSKRSYRERLETHLRSRLDRPGIGLDDAAAALRMSPRTLRRRLHDENASFADVLDEVRRTRAVELIVGTDLSVAEVGFSVGFTSTGAFRRAFRRWTGTSASRYRIERDAS